MLEAELSGNPFAHFLVGEAGAAGRSWFRLDCRVSLFLGRLRGSTADEPGGHRVDAAQGYRQGLGHAGSGDGAGPSGEVRRARSAGFKPCRACTLPEVLDFAT